MYLRNISKRVFLKTPAYIFSSSIYCVNFSSKAYFEEVKNRGVIRINGKDASSFLQGLITNDVNHLDNCKSIYTLFLNTKGRIKYDSIIFKGFAQDEFFIESDRSILSSLEKHLKIYRLRKDVNVLNLDRDLKVFIVYNVKSVFNLVPELFKPYFPLDSNALQNVNDEVSSNIEMNTIFCSDPRVGALGTRHLCYDTADLINSYCAHDIDLIEPPVPIYKALRYMLGVAEGLEEIPFEQCFPLEMNADYLHGVSFQKGCYIGQELTARSYHTGVIRKRIMPLIFDSPDTEGLPVDVRLPDEDKNVGKVRGADSIFGIALLRVKECLGSSHLRVGNLKALCFQPLWWPTESQKEKSTNV